MPPFRYFAIVAHIFGKSNPFSKKRKENFEKMKYERKKRCLLASPEDVVAFALPTYAMREEAPPARLGGGEETKETVFLNLPLGDVTCEIESDVTVKENVCFLSFSVAEDPRRLSKEALGFVRGNDGGTRVTRTNEGRSIALAADTVSSSSASRSSWTSSLCAG